jgi:hypothetical protein
MTIITSNPIPDITETDVICYKTIIMYNHKKRAKYLTQCAEYKVTAGHLAGMKYLEDGMFDDNLFFNRYKINIEQNGYIHDEDVYITDNGMQVYVNIPENFGFNIHGDTPQRKFDNAILYKCVIPKGTRFYSSKGTEYQKELMLTAERIAFIEPVIIGKGLDKDRLENATQYINRTKDKYGQLDIVTKYALNKEPK